MGLIVNQSLLIFYGLLMLWNFGACAGHSEYLGVEWLKPGSKIKFDGKEVPHVGILNRLNWVEKNERTTSENDTLWEKADVFLLEWPGNVTLFSADNPSVKWGRNRAKYIEDHCGMEHTGIEMRAYAYKLVYLTWGPNRLTKTYTAPLTVPRSILPFTTLAKLSKKYSYNENKLNVVVVFDIAFVFDALLLAYSEGIIRVSGLEMAWAEVSTSSTTPLQYSTSKGINVGVDRLVVQNCCLRTEFCPFGDLVVSYQEFSFPHTIYVSSDGGKHFKQLRPTLEEAGHLRIVFVYPELDQILLFHGNSTDVKLNRVVLSSGRTISLENDVSKMLKTRGSLQGSRLGMDASLIIWDSCTVWYSPDMGVNVSKSLFYVHKKISNSKLHQILPEYCTFGEKSTLAYGKTGQFGILDSNNVFFLGIDTKSNLSQLVALKMDISLLIAGSELSVVPHFDILEQPKLLYPPKFLRPPKQFELGKRYYERRLAMRLLPKNVYPSDFMLSFYEENAQITSKGRKFLLRKCQTSSLQINNSITQRRKLYHVSLDGTVNFAVAFKSRQRAVRQLKFEPRYILKYLAIKTRPVSIDMVEQENPRYWIKYNVSVKSSGLWTRQKLFRLTFYAENALRCHYQPRVSVYIHVNDTGSTGSSHHFQKETLSDADMSRTAYLKSVTADHTQYLGSEGMGETFQMNACPLSKK